MEDRTPAAATGRLGALAAFGVLLVLAACTLFASSSLMSTSCIGDSGQMLCPSSGPDWARPLPGWAVLAGLLAGVTGLVGGRTVRTPALTVGFLLVLAALAAGRLLT